MTYRTFVGACVGAIIFSACSSDEQTPFVGSDSGAGGTGAGGAGAGGSSTGGAKSSGGSGNGGASTGGTSPGGAGGKATGGAAGAGGKATGGAANGGNAGTGGAATGGAPADSGTDGSTTDGSADGGGPCAGLSTCCTSLSGQRKTACNTIANAGNASNCTAVNDLFCAASDAGGVSDAGGAGGCTHLATCCGDSGRAAQCNRIVANGDNAVCNQVAAFFCP